MTKKTILDIINELQSILDNTENVSRSRDRMVLDFVSKISQNNSGEYDDFIDELAYDMDYYDSDKRAQERVGYFGDEKLNKMLGDAMQKLREQLEEIK